MALLLDTCAVIWLVGDSPIRREVDLVIEQASIVEEPIYVSPVTAWEVGQLSARGRLNLQMDPQLWFERLLQRSRVKLITVSPEILISASYLPGKPPNDPADRIFAATARKFGHRLVTRDRLLLDYASDGHIDALAC